MVFSNVSEIYQGAVLAKEIGCDYYEVKPMYNIDHFSIIHRKELMKQAKGLIKQSLALEGDGFKVLQAAKLHHILNGESNIEPKDYTRCAVSQLRTLVTPSGTYVSPYFRGRGDKNIGNVSKGTDLEVNPTKGKQLTNMRASGADDSLNLTPPIKLTLERALEIMNDELLEITPKSIRLRKP